MTYSKWLAALTVGTVTALGACAPEPAPAPGVIYAEPVFNKFGNPSCRPGDVPIGGAYTADLPICPVIGGEPVVVVVPEVGDTNGVVVVPDDPIVDPDDPVVDPDDPVDDPTGGNQNQNQNNNQNNNQNQNSNQNQNQNSNQGG